MFQKPKAAKRLYFDVIPKAVDEYFTFLDAFPGQSDRAAARQSGLAHPCRRAAAGRHADRLLRCCSISPRLQRPRQGACCGASSCATSKGVTPESHPKLDELVGYAVRYYDDFVAPTKVFREPDDVERAGAGRARPARSPVSRPMPTRRNPERRLEVGRSFERFQDTARRRPGRRPGRVARLVRDALPDPARHGARAALRLLRRDLRHPRDPGADRPGARRRTGRLTGARLSGCRRHELGSGAAPPHAEPGAARRIGGGPR